MLATDNIVPLRSQPKQQFAIAVRQAVAAFRATGRMIDAALVYAAHGFPVFPLDPVSKAPIPRRDPDPSGEYSYGVPGTGGVYKATCDETQIRGWWKANPRALIGLPMGERSGLWALDVDTDEEHQDGTVAWSELAAQHDPFETREHRSGSGGAHLIFNWYAAHPIRCGRGALPKAGIEVKGQGGYIAVPPSQRKGRSYTVFRDIDPIDAPVWLVNTILEGREPSDDDAPTLDAPLEELSELAEALEFIPNEELPWDDWNNINLAIFAASGGSEAGRTLMDRFAQKSTKYHVQTTRERWNEIKRSPPERIGSGYLFKMARQHGWKRKPHREQAEPEQQSTPDPTHVSPDAERKAMRKVGRNFLYGDVFDPDNPVINYFRDYAFYGAGPDRGLGPSITAARSDVGGSKTTVAIEETAKWIKRTGKVPVIYAVPRHELGEEIVALFFPFPI